MNRNIVFRILVVVLLVVNIAASIYVYLQYKPFVLSSFEKESDYTRYTLSEEAIMQIDSVASDKYFAVPISSNVHIPQTMTFAGEKIPLQRIDVREALKRELYTNTYLHSRTLLLLERVEYYFNIIEPILKREGVHDDFKYLAVAESALDPIAYSSANAAGMWQFISSTGKRYGLKINKEVDERYHIEKSTVAACKYLKENHEEFKTWTLTAASYNAGENAIRRFLSKQKEKSYFDIRMSQETNRYVFRILALKQIIENPEMYHFKTHDLFKEGECNQIVVTKTITDLADFAHKHNISYKILRRLNPWLISNRLTVKHNEKYTILVPKNPALYK